MKRLFLVIMMTVFVTPSPKAETHHDTVKGVALMLTVGLTGDCDHNNITDAILDPQTATEIRVSNEQVYNENLIVDRDLELKGGYASCADALLDIREEGVMTVVDAQNLGNAIYFSSADAAFHVSGFLLENGVAQGVSPELARGGAVTLRGLNLNVSFTDTIIRNSHGTEAGGIRFAASGTSVLVLDQTLVLDNISAGDGGGITCTGLGSPAVYLNNQSGVVRNVASLNGGGIYLSGCDAHLNSGTGGIDADINWVGVSANSAGHSGGGIYAQNGVTIFTPDANNADAHPINIDNNIANTDAVAHDGNGGGVFLLNSTISVNNLFVNKNTVINGDGGGLYLDNSNISVNGELPYIENYCALNGFSECNLFSNNQAIQGLNTDGGAIYMTNNSGMTYAMGAGIHANFYHNLAYSGSVVDLNSGSNIRIQNAYMVGNGLNGAGDTYDFPPSTPT